MTVGGQLITSIITRDACRELNLKKGARVFALISTLRPMTPLSPWYRFIQSS